MGVGAEKRRENCVEVVAEVRSDGDEGSLRCVEGMVRYGRYVR